LQVNPFFTDHGNSGTYGKRRFKDCVMKSFVGAVFALAAFVVAPLSRRMPGPVGAIPRTFDRFQPRRSFAVTTATVAADRGLSLWLGKALQPSILEVLGVRGPVHAGFVPAMRLSIAAPIAQRLPTRTDVANDAEIAAGFERPVAQPLRLVGGSSVPAQAPAPAWRRAATLGVDRIAA
jgi:hypothetical protein